MGRCLVFPFLILALALLPSRTAAEQTFYDLWRLMLPHNLLPTEAIPDHLPSGEVTAAPIAGETGDKEDSETRVDFGTKAWPHVYYARRDRKGTVDWGTMAWPYVYYSRRDGKRHTEADSNVDAVAAGTDGKTVSAVHIGRKGE